MYFVRWRRLGWQKPVHEPTSPFRDEKGYVYYPNVDPLVEMVDAMVTARSYQANATAFDATKSMMSAALRMLAG